MSGGERATRIEESSLDLPSRATAAWIALAVLLLFAAAYEPLLHAGWIWDDDSYVTQDPAVLKPGGVLDAWTLTFDGHKGAWISNTPQYYPLVFTTFWIEHQVWGLEPLGFHLVNALLHLVNAWLVFAILRRLAVPGAWLIAALWLLHPMNVESVAWVTERKNVLSGLFYLLAFLAYLRFDDTGAKRTYAASFALFVCALLSKSVTATLPLAILVALFWKRRSIAGRDLARVAPFVVVGAASGWFTAHLEQVKVGATSAEFAQTAVERVLLIVPRAFGFYGLHVLWPQPISFVYERWEPHFADATTCLWALGIAGVFLAAFFLRKRVGWGPLLCLLFSAVTLAPALGFVPVFPHRYSWVADHFAYLGILGFLVLYASAAIAWLRRLGPAMSRTRATVLLGLVVLVPCAWQTHAAAESYESAEILWRDTLAKNDEAWIAMLNLGIEIMQTEPLTPEREAEALALFQRGERYPSGRAQALVNQARWHLRKKQNEEAATLYRRAIEADPSSSAARQGLSATLAQQALELLNGGHYAEALAVCRRALSEVGPDDRILQLDAWIEATSPDEKLRNGPHARQLAQRLVEKQPANFGFQDTLAAACAESGDFASAVKHAETAIDLARKSGNTSGLPQIEARLALYRAGKPYRHEAK